MELLILKPEYIDDKIKEQTNIKLCNQLSFREHMNMCLLWDNERAKKIF